MARDTSKYRYCIIYHEGEEVEPDYTFESVWDEDDLEYLAEDAAEDYQFNHDGWEANWPLQFAIFNDDGVLLGKFEVEREYSPSFSASAI